MLLECIARNRTVLDCDVTALLGFAVMSTSEENRSTFCLQDERAPWLLYLIFVSSCSGCYSLSQYFSAFDYATLFRYAGDAPLDDNEGTCVGIYSTYQYNFVSITQKIVRSMDKADMTLILQRLLVRLWLKVVFCCNCLYVSWEYCRQLHPRSSCLMRTFSSQMGRVVKD